MRKVLLLVFAAFWMMGCSEQTTLPTQAQLTAQKLTETLGADRDSFTGGRVMYLYRAGGALIYTATAYWITSDGFINVSAGGADNYTYNLDYLTSFSIYPAGTRNVSLYFSF